MAENTQNTSSLTDQSSNSTIYNLNLEESIDSNDPQRVEESIDSCGLTESSHGSSILLTDNSLNILEEFPGFSQGDDSLDSDMKDPFNSIFYHVMPLKDSTNIIFYHRPLYEDTLRVLSKQYTSFPSANAEKCRIKTHVDGLQCYLRIDRSVMSLSASGPGHISWKEKHFKRLSENIYRSFVHRTNSMLSVNTDLVVINDSLSASQVSTQPNKSGLLPCNTGATVSHDSPVMKQISTLMDMINSLQGQISELTNQVNELVSQAAYKTVDETYATEQTSVIQTPHPEHNIVSSPTQFRTYSEVLQPPAVTSHQQIEETTGLNTVGVQKTSTPKSLMQQKKPDRTPETPTLNPQSSRENHENIEPRPSQQRRNIPKNILLIGDSLTSAINPKGLKQGVFKHSISGAKIDHIFHQAVVFNMEQFSNIIIYVGGNDASSGTDIEYFEELYDQVIQNIKQVNSTCQIFLCNAAPRGDTDTTDVNMVIDRLCQEHNITLLDINKAFYDKQGIVVERYYGDDLIHLSASGVKRLLGEVDKQINIVENFENSVFKSHYQKKSGNRRVNPTRKWKPHGSPRNSRTHKNHKNRITNNGSAVPCYKCGETNHETREYRHKGQVQCDDCGFKGHKSRRCLNK